MLKCRTAKRLRFFTAKMFNLRTVQRFTLFGASRFTPEQPLLDCKKVDSCTTT
jgi:hypothetical protein